jgi:ATP-dependent RNA helicase DBP3
LAPPSFHLSKFQTLNPEIGRLLDVSEDPSVLLLSHIAFLVLDEADRMLDLGFEPAVRAIVEKMKKPRQTVMFSATWPRDIQKLAGTFMREDRVFVSIGSTSTSASTQVTQIVEVIEARGREHRLRELLDEYQASDHPPPPQHLRH